MNTLLLCITIIVLVIYFEWELVKTALTPILDIVVSLWFIIMLLVVIVTELALIVVAPVALLLGFESRQWHINVAKKLMYSGIGEKKNVDTD